MADEAPPIVEYLDTLGRLQLLKVLNLANQVASAYGASADADLLRNLADHCGAEIADAVLVRATPEAAVATRVVVSAIFHALLEEEQDRLRRRQELYAPTPN